MGIVMYLIFIKSPEYFLFQGPWQNHHYNVNQCSHIFLCINQYIVGQLS